MKRGHVDGTSSTRRVDTTQDMIEEGSGGEEDAESTAEAAMRRVRAAKEGDSRRWKARPGVERGYFDFAGCWEVLEEVTTKRKRFQGQLASKHAAGLEAERSKECGDSRLAALIHGGMEYEAALKRDVALRITRGQAEVNRRLKEYDLSTGELVRRRSTAGRPDTGEYKPRPQQNIHPRETRQTKRYAFGRVVPPYQGGEMVRRPPVLPCKASAGHAEIKANTNIQSVPLHADKLAKRKGVKESPSKTKERLGGRGMQKNLRAKLEGQRGGRERGQRAGLPSEWPLSKMDLSSNTCSTNWSSLVPFDQSNRHEARDTAAEALEVARSLLSSSTGFEGRGSNDRRLAELQECAAGNDRETQKVRKQEQTPDSSSRRKAFISEPDMEDDIHPPSCQDAVEKKGSLEWFFTDVSDTESLWTYSLGELPCHI
eukprot:scaffold285_cov330-Pavlova_lutheri.AAC.25